MMRPPMPPTPPTRSFPFMNSSFSPPAAYPQPRMGGFLSRLLSRGQPMMPSSPFSSLPMMQNAVSSASTATSGGGISGMLTNVQKMLGIAQNVVPMVQQYGPFVKNLPAMIKIFRELKPTDDNSESETSDINPAKEKEAKEEKKQHSKDQKEHKPRELPSAKSTPKERTPKEAKPSTPKLYI
ncbi:hypothetical protein B6A27_12790 [Anoxybacillus sp. UARK-01]|uniref:VrrA/YqfQ family protein n=1 Tax=Anoxybacillaceae TaxID=3120669 RepID=UPI0009B9A9CC|nr:MULTISPECIES: VrrA/YqfQ family protein [Anoxybacillus]MBB3906885.1 Sec-independent protein translocase protein TatA [Anoxybacillus rupiensis]OQM44917.1 hypothetical protein B6A27_12790 [Anoxybacillus sp. UARK-01]